MSPRKSGRSSVRFSSCHEEGRQFARLRRHCSVDEGRTRGLGEAADLAAAAAALRDRFSTARLRRRSSTVSPPAAAVSPLAAGVGAAAGPFAAASMAGVLTEDADEVDELIQTASPLRDHCDPSSLVVVCCSSPVRSST